MRLYLDDVLSDAQIRQLARALIEVSEHGYGKVVITVDKGHPAFIEVVRSERFEPVPFVQ
jgi:hypothetical protein